MSNKDPKAEQLKANGLRQATEEAKRQRAENNLLKVLLALMIYQINGGEGDHWRVVFSPQLIEFGKTLALKIDAGRQALTLTDVQQMIANHLKIDVVPFGLPEELEKLLPPDQIKKTFVASVSFAKDPAWLREKPLPDPIKVIEQRLPPEVSETPAYLVSDVAPQEGETIKPLASSAPIVFDAIDKVREEAIKSGLLTDVNPGEEPPTVQFFKELEKLKDSDQVGILPDGKTFEIATIEKDGLPSTFRGKRRYCEECEEFVELGAEHECKLPV